MVAHRVLDQARGLGAGQAVLGLALELRVADEDRQHQLAAGDDVVGGDVLGLLLADQLAEGADALGQRGAQALLRACRRRASGWCCSNSCRSRPTTAARRPPIRRGPAARPGKVLRAGEELAGDAFAVAELLARDGRRGRRGTGTPPLRGRRRWSATGRISSGSRRRRRDRPWSGRGGTGAPGLNFASVAEDLGVGGEGDGGAAPVGRAAPSFFERPRSAGRARSPGGTAPCCAPPRRTVSVESALTTLTPTPCRPPEVA